MKPKLLKISGLNSFVEEQTIDFSKLIEGGLFGIFGPTGSGKSTILDAITIALYGHNAMARGTKEFINTDMEKVFVSYDFDCGSLRGRQAYRIERSIKKNKRGGIKTDFARLSFLDTGGNVERLVDRVSDIDDEVREIIGLNHRDFTRSVVLPQGKFSEFLKLAGSERRNMLERILGLEKYGGSLIDKIRSYKRKKEEELNLLNGEMNRFEGVTEENIKELRKELEEIEGNEYELKTEIALIEKKYEELNRIWDLQTELNKHMKIKGELDSKGSEIQELRLKWQKGVQARNVKPYLDRYDEIFAHIEKNKRLLVDIFKSLEKNTMKLEKIESKYKEVFIKKEEELPALIERELLIKNAIELQESVDKLSRDRDKLKEKFKGYSNRIKDLQNGLDKLKAERERCNKEIEGLENRCKGLKVSPEYRQRLNEAWRLKSTYDELIKSSMESLKNIESLKLKTKTGKELMNKTSRELLDRERRCNDLKAELEKLEIEPPRDKEYILKREMELHKLRDILEKANENLQRRVEIEKKLEITVSNKENSQIKLSYLKKRYDEDVKKLKNVGNEIKELKKSHMAGLLSLNLMDNSPCPVCGSMEHPNAAHSINGETIEKIVKIRDGFEDSQRETEKCIYKQELEIKECIKEESRLNNELNLYIEKLKGHDIFSIKENIKASTVEIEGCKSTLKAWEEKKRALAEGLQRAERERLQLEKQSIRFTEGLKRDEERLEDEKKKKNQIDKRLNEIKGSYDKVKIELKIENVDEAVEEVRKREKEFSEHEDRLKQLRSLIKDLDIDREKLEDNLKTDLLERGKIEEAGKEKRGVIDEYTEKINRIVGDSDAKNCLREIVDRRLLIIKEEETLRKLKDEERDNLNKLQERKAGIANTVKTLEASSINIERDFNAALKENKFDNSDEVKIYILPEDELNLIDKHINSFDDEKKKVKLNINRIETELKGEVLEEDDFVEFKENMKLKKESHSAALEEMGKKKERINEMEKNYGRIKELNGRIQNLEHTRDMLGEMFKLVSGNKFVEYVATSHLKYVAREASKRLMDITNKRYSLELDSGGSFIICDNYNGGVRRDCNTLSGGETFLTSLALALSLSSQIQLKGNASIEFFFLDEGFGTLDNQLLDTVMTSLEKLHEEKLAVGIISHVGELKSRVPIKLLVTPSEAGLHGTKVVIERN